MLENLSKFGEALGIIAFQIHDDILGVFSDEGKSVVSDVKEGKLILVYSYTLEHGNAQQREVLDRVYAKG